MTSEERVTRGILCFLALLLAFPARAAQNPVTAADLAALQAELDSVKADYEQRIADLETQIEELQIQMLRSAAEPSSSPPAAAATASQVNYNALNPAISAIGNFIGRADNQRVFNEDGDRIDDTLNLREVEVDLRVPVDPYADAVMIASFESEMPGTFSAGIEEGYVNIKKLPFMESPLGLKFQVGRFRPAFGRFNTLHTHDLPQSTRSLATQEFLGEEGFIQQGVSADFFVPLPVDDNSSLNARLQILGGGDVALAPESNQRLAYLGNLRWFRSYGSSHSTDIGWSSYIRPGTADHPVARMHAVDFLYRWRPTRLGQWKSYLLGGEVLFADHARANAAEPVEVAEAVEPLSPDRDDQRPMGYSVFTQWQFDRRKYGGLRWDDSSTLVDPGVRRRSMTPYMSYYFSEFLRLRLNLEHRWSDIALEDGRNSFWVELNWIFGAHPPEPFWVNR